MASIARALIIEFKYLDDIRSFFLKNNAKHHQSSCQFLGVIGLRHFEHYFFNFLYSNVLLGLGQCMNCFLVIKAISVSRIHIYIALCNGLRFMRPTICAWYLGKGGLYQSLHPSHDALLCKISRIQIPRQLLGFIRSQD